MTATCTLCNQVVSVEPDLIIDAQRDERTMGKLGVLLKQHIDRYHMHGPILDMEDTGRVSPAQMIGIIGLCSQMVGVQSFFESTDPAFLVNRARLLAIVSRSMQPKEKPVVATTSTVSP